MTTPIRARRRRSWWQMQQYRRLCVYVHRHLAPSTIAWSLYALAQLRADVPRLPMPDAYPGPNDELLYTWDRKEHHLELEIYADGSMEAFYRNRNDGSLWAGDVGLPAIPDAWLGWFRIMQCPRRIQKRVITR